MAGFFGLFGGKTKYIDEPDQGDSLEENEQKEPFFLSPDEAKTMGNIDFMRKPIGSKKNLANNEAKASEPQKGSNSNVPSVQRRSGDGSLDMFRNMAKEIKKP